MSERFWLAIKMISKSPSQKGYELFGTIDCQGNENHTKKARTGFSSSTCFRYQAAI
ncbi:hypothetical protein ACFC6J_05695 [Enterococcus casseliflavus]|uniref:hypothetical protein n=1 Tax=Enterococcus casseliflavus TaxID=37734 RepID=UPI00163D005F|nr:hypothetical protein [Enterococcus casseliflavus]